MYVKVLDHNHNRAAVIYDTDPSQPVHFGRERVDADPSGWSANEAMRALHIGGDSFDFSHLGGDHAGSYGATGGNYWMVGWVRFHKPGSPEVHLVASTTPIYLLDDSGKTVDRV